MVRDDNKSYCPLPFNEIYSSNRGDYNLCCHAITADVFRNVTGYSQSEPRSANKFKTKDITPFKFFLSDEMNEIREKMLNGETIPLCIKCYGHEESVGYSTRTKLITDILKKAEAQEPIVVDPLPTEVGKIALKLRMYGNYCNLSCVMCLPYNSTTKANELKTSGLGDIFWQGTGTYGGNTYKQWEETKKDILDHIHLIDKFHLTGGEPLLLPKHWELLMEIPNDIAKNINLHYDTNFTSLNYKNYSIDDLIDKFKRVNFSVSCDHYKDKLGFIRYPIDVESFENNLMEAHKNVSKLSCTVFILNVNDIMEIKKYYSENFNIKVETPSIVHYPKMLNVRHLPDIIKENLIDKYKNQDNCPFVTELYKDRSEHLFQKGLSYIKRLAEFRKMNVSKLWPEYFS